MDGGADGGGEPGRRRRRLRARRRRQRRAARRADAGRVQPRGPGRPALPPRGAQPALPEGRQRRLVVRVRVHGAAGRPVRTRRGVVLGGRAVRAGGGGPLRAAVAHRGGVVADGGADGRGGRHAGGRTGPAQRAVGGAAPARRAGARRGGEADLGSADGARQRGDQRLPDRARLGGEPERLVDAGPRHVLHGDGALRAGGARHPGVLPGARAGPAGRRQRALERGVRGHRRAGGGGGGAARHRRLVRHPHQRVQRGEQCAPRRVRTVSFRRRPRARHLPPLGHPPHGSEHCRGPGK